MTNYGWDQANRLTGYGTTATYRYNGDGLRMSKTVSGSSQPFVWDTAEGLPLAIQDGTTSYVTGPGGLPLEQVAGTAVTYYHGDQLGSTRALSNSSGAVVASYNFDAYGNPIGTPPAFANPFGFTGQYTDGESGWMFLRARYDDPGSGQFTTRDPLTAVTRAPYAYTSDNPLNATDPGGLYNCGWQPWNCVQLPTSVGQAWNQFSSNVRNPQTLVIAGGAGLVAGAAAAGCLCGGCAGGVGGGWSGWSCSSGAAAMSTVIASNDSTSGPAARNLRLATDTSDAELPFPQGDSLSFS